MEKGRGAPSRQREGRRRGAARSASSRSRTRRDATPPPPSPLTRWLRWRSLGCADLLLSSPNPALFSCLAAGFLARHCGHLSGYTRFYTRVQICRARTVLGRPLLITSKNESKYACKFLATQQVHALRGGCRGPLGSGHSDGPLKCWGNRCKQAATSRGSHATELMGTWNGVCASGGGGRHALAVACSMACARGAKRFKAKGKGDSAKVGTSEWSVQVMTRAAHVRRGDARKAACAWSRTATAASSASCFLAGKTRLTAQPAASSDGQGAVVQPGELDQVLLGLVLAHCRARGGGGRGRRAAAVPDCSMRPPVWPLIRVVTWQACWRAGATSGHAGPLSGRLASSPALRSASLRMRAGRLHTKSCASAALGLSPVRWATSQRWMRCSMILQ